MYLPTLCGLNPFGLKSQQASEKTAGNLTSRNFPQGRQLVRQEVNLRTLKAIIRQAVEEVEGAETSKRLL